ncbi:MAG: hypothetical protein H6677_05430 [Candidatus Obscuribacterales bacterium]|nr:hypothetical protein [Candidatus Obscuribacterales bacterium]
MTAVSNFASGSPYKFSVNPSVQGIIAHNRARVLSEPTLYASPVNVRPSWLVEKSPSCRQSPPLVRTSSRSHSSPSE